MRNSKQKYLRPVLAGLALLLGGISMVLPFIPLGYILLFVGLVLLIPYNPKLRKASDKLKDKDDSGKLERAEDKLDEVLGADEEGEASHGSN